MDAAFAIDPHKAALSLAQQAAKSFEAGDMQRAAQLYLEAFRIDDTEVNFLYGAARAEQAGGQTERATEHLQQFVGTPGADPARVEKAKGYLAEMRNTRADAQVQSAERAMVRGDSALAASAYLEAWKIAPDRVGLLIKVAMAEREAGDSDAAVAHLRELLRVAPADAAERKTAAELIERFRPKAGAAKATISPEPIKPADSVPVAQPSRHPVVATAVPSGVVAQSTPTKVAGGRVAAWSTLGGGVAVLVVGVSFYAWGLAGQSSLNSQLDYHDGQVHTTLSKADAQAQANTIGTHETIGIVTAGVGLAVMGVGTWLLLREPKSQAMVLPTRDGLALTVAF